LAGDHDVRSSEPALGVVPEGQLLRRSELNLSTPWEEPRTEVQIKLAAIWKQVLGINDVGLSDDFFELGGDSFAATALAAEIEAAFQLRFAPSDIINLSTVAKQAETVAAQTEGLAPERLAHLILSRAGGTQPPLFIVHGGLGFVFLKPEFLDEIGRERPVYLFQAPGLDGRTELLGKIEDFARLYVETLRKVQPSGPYNIVAMCAGSFIALEMCNQIEEAGDSVARLVLLDPPAMPPTLKDDRAEAKVKRSEARRRAVMPRVWRFLGESRETKEIKRTAKRREKMMRIRDTIRTRLDELHWISTQEGPYSDEALAKVAEQLRIALDAHVPRHYSGKAAILVNSTKAHKILDRAGFWRSHLGAIEQYVCGADHHEVFRGRLMETARFVTRSLD
jgi:thioesterase domain-containing protein/acyl carrier protein